MSFPVGASTITVTGTFPAPVGGGSRKGRVVFTPTAVLVDSTQHAIYSGGGPAVIVNGAMTATLLCNDDPDIKPTGWRWRVDEQPAGGQWRTYYIDLPSTLGATVHLDQVAEVSAPDGGTGGGTAGPQGPAGPTGPQGPTGATGATGPQGPVGPAGPTGATGPQGPAGADGADGATGPKGDTGDAGPAGATGATGPQGEQGIQGEQGPAGATGATGPQGDVGPQGPTGATGNTGATGPTGATGAAGPQGTQGLQGVPGIDGSGNRTATVRISDGAVQDLASAASWTIAATSVGTQLKVSILAEPGDRVSLDVGSLYSGTRYIDAVLLDTAGAIALYAGTGTSSPLAEGNPEFYPSTSFGKASSGIEFTVTSAHLVNGLATVALANQGTGAGKIYAYSGYPLRLKLTNLGPQPAPTGISVAQTSTPTSGYIKYAPAGVTLSGSDVTGPFSYLGAGGFQIGSGTPDSTYVLPTTRYPNTRGTLSSSQSIYSIEFGTDATAFQLRFNWQTGGSCRITVDGRRMTDLMQSLGGTTLGSTHLMTVTLGAIAQPRTVRIDFSVAPFGGIFLPPGASMWKPATPAKRFMVLGDSIPGGSNMNTGGGSGTWFARAARLLGYSDAWNEALGGTGYITAGSTATLGTRAPIDVIPNNPDVLIISAGYNDNGGSQPSISSAAASLYSAIKTGLPNTTIYVIGCWSPTGSPASSITNTDTTLRTAAAAASLPFISPITGGVYNAAGTLIATHGPWITGTGRVGATTGTGNADTYIGTDAVHPTDAGHTYLAGRVVAAVQELQNA
ncbi:GDSL-type esterase/lipase family protein [Streptomyces sp. WM6373]|uniref:GDSL-type esterase/lipase family protein n=1 Tax=Streptomyces sp. WM6373 TaxID=1415556 RepID=UPI0006AECC70|nr:GDSL-type esterase/lipase family protein [Streptomyces sp. WM6373]